ncbi:HNH endonuclease family protein [Flexivirga oryzae]|uniref:GmrSD restriction endonucleases C-terminal domain-containing protein n=1 Tax=Flexivirga oryzae TaxID=1794944 RepID=A0A839N1E3_9MICO|nr:hypothetical protein [Flexivirga oryzae]
MPPTPKKRLWPRVVGAFVAVFVVLGVASAVSDALRGDAGNGRSGTVGVTAAGAAPSSGPSRTSTAVPAGASARSSNTTPTVDPAAAKSQIAKSTHTRKPSAALAELAALRVKGRAPKTAYTRGQFGPAWTDDVTVAGGHNGCDTRNDILARDLTAITFKPGTRDCAVLTGTLHDPYTGKTIVFHRGIGSSDAVQIDHVVALSDAWQTGAQQLSAAQRQNFANDPLNLQAVDGPTNESKGAGDAATWLPPNKAYRCTYVTRQVEVKTKYHLWVTPAEHDAIARVLRTCGGTAAAATTPSITPATTRAMTPSPAASTTRAPLPAAPAQTAPLSAGCTPLSNGGHCYKLREFCAKRYRGTAGVSADGERMVCRDNNGWRWEPV